MEGQLTSPKQPSLFYDGVPHTVTPHASANGEKYSPQVWRIQYVNGLCCREMWLNSGSTHLCVVHCYNSALLRCSHHTLCSDRKLPASKPLDWNLAIGIIFTALNLFGRVLGIVFRPGARFPTGAWTSIYSLTALFLVVHSFAFLMASFLHSW